MSAGVSFTSTTTTPSTAAVAPLNSTESPINSLLAKDRKKWTKQDKALYDAYIKKTAGSADANLIGAKASATSAEANKILAQSQSSVNDSQVTDARQERRLTNAVGTNQFERNAYARRTMSRWAKLKAEDPEAYEKAEERRLIKAGVKRDPEKDKDRKSFGAVTGADGKFRKYDHERDKGIFDKGSGDVVSQYARHVRDVADTYRRAGVEAQKKAIAAFDEDWKKTHPDGSRDGYDEARKDYLTAEKTKWREANPREKYLRDPGVLSSPGSRGAAITGGRWHDLTQGTEDVPGGRDVSPGFSINEPEYERGKMLLTTTDLRDPSRKLQVDIDRDKRVDDVLDTVQGRNIPAHNSVYTTDANGKPIDLSDPDTRAGLGNQVLTNNLKQAYTDDPEHFSDYTNALVEADRKETSYHNVANWYTSYDERKQRTADALNDVAIETDAQNTLKSYGIPYDSNDGIPAAYTVGLYRQAGVIPRTPVVSKPSVVEKPGGDSTNFGGSLGTNVAPSFGSHANGDVPATTPDEQDTFYQNFLDGTQADILGGMAMSPRGWLDAYLAGR